MKDDGGSAFPIPAYVRPSDGMTEWPVEGMSVRHYAAIKLRVPDTGTDWLDDMIRDSLRNEFAGMALQGLCSGDVWPGVSDAPRMAEMAYTFADAMLAEREKEA